MKNKRFLVVALNVMMVLVITATTFAQSCDNTLGIGDFETFWGDAWWHPYSFETVAPYNPINYNIIDYDSTGTNRVATLGGYHNQWAEIRTQTFIHPAATVTFSYDYTIDSTDYCASHHGGAWYDSARVQVRSLTSGALIVDQPYELCQAKNTTGFYSQDITPYIGHDIEISVEVQTDHSYLSKFIIDNISVDVCY